MLVPSHGAMFLLALGKIHEVGDRVWKWEESMRLHFSDFIADDIETIFTYQGKLGPYDLDAVLTFGQPYWMERYRKAKESLHQSVSETDAWLAPETGYRIDSVRPSIFSNLTCPILRLPF